MKKIEANNNDNAILSNGYYDTETPKTSNLKTVMGIAIPLPDRLDFLFSF
ncbi:hypothetical protein J1N35_040440 [Gossypium stocksii]|uniref:Uncharacterized protein n=1 Tax=Gossypium stocksii TaxID=47602 RepID=A0A9D3ZIC4_9ROSI|nr:hypothetical protein J1N35_040440 [Gossypium stocksii]